LNQEGQAYSTFKLLIAAIVAMAILAILIPIIMNVMGLITADPTNEARSLLSDLVGSPGAIKRTTEVTFTPDSVLAASALAERLPISSDQICMSTGQFGEDPDTGFQCLNCGDTSKVDRLIYHGNANLTAKIAVVCNVSLEELTKDIGDYGLNSYNQDVTAACQICVNKGKCCAVVLERS
jgi:hypothetical protein